MRWSSSCSPCQPETIPRGVAVGWRDAYGTRLLANCWQHASTRGSVKERPGARRACHTPQFGRLERSETQLNLDQLCRAAAAVGLRASVRLFPDGDPVRDAGQLALLARLRARLPTGTTWQTEVPLPIPGDRRSWDAVVTLGNQRMACEAETRPRDVQALERRIALKSRDGGIDVVILVMSDTAGNRRLLDAHREALSDRSSRSTRERSFAASAVASCPGGAGSWCSERGQVASGTLWTMLRLDPSTALIVVDVQNDFADPAGGLSVAGGEEIIPRLNAVIEDARAAGALVAYTQDWHPETTPHFEKDGGIWPVHCVAGTWGADFHPDLQVDGPVVRKGSNGEDGYSGFTMRDPASGETRATPLDALLREHAIGRVLVAGLATDYCVKATALDAVQLGYDTVLLTDAVAAVNLTDGDGDRAIEEMQSRGVQVSAETRAT